MVKALRKRHAQRLALHCKAVQKSDPGMAGAAVRCFGSHDAALSAAGIDPARVRQQREPWDKAAVVAALVERRNKGLGLHVTAVKSHAGLYPAAVKCFGSHDAALRAAGIDPAGVRRRTVPWDKQQVIAELRRRFAAGDPLYGLHLRRHAPVLHDAMRSKFGSHRAALSAAGIEYSRPRPPVRVWTDERIISGIGAFYQQLWAEHPDGKYPRRRLRGEYTPLYRAACARFGSIKGALEAAGIHDPRLMKRWKPEEVLDALRGLARNGETSFLEVRDADARLPNVARTHFGTLKAAVEAAGIRYVNRGTARSRPAGHWTEDLVLKSLRDLHRDSHDLRYRQMRQHSQPLFYAAKQLFGTYVNAVRQAGIDYWQMSQSQLANEKAARKPGYGTGEVD